MNNTTILIALTCLDGIGPRTISKLLTHCGETLPKTAADIHTQLSELRANDRRITGCSLEAIQAALDTAATIEARCADLSIQTISVLDTIFPQGLVGLKTLPPILYLKGDTSVLDRPTIGVIGTRSPVPYARKAAYRIAYRLAEQDLCVLSGLARGCDAHAHKGCLDAQGSTIAVLPCGLDQVYPREHSELATRILAQGGCLISEYPPGTSAASYRMVARDRLQAALSDALIVAQSTATGGAMHAARTAMEQLRRPVAAVQPPLDSDDREFSGNAEIMEHPLGHKLLNRSDLEAFIARLYSGSLIRAVLFDLDMTLVDSSPIAHLRDRRDWSAVRRRISDVSPYPGVNALIGALRRAGFKLGIVSSAPKWYIEALCSRFGWGMDVVIGFHDASAPKPSPEPLLIAARRLGLTTTACTYIGDDIIDLRTARAARSLFFAAGWSPTGYALANEAPTPVTPDEVIPLLSTVESRRDNQFS